MTKLWHNLYLPTENTQAIITTLRDTLTAQDYTLYDPFGTVIGKSYRDRVRLFVTPSHHQWTRILGTPTTHLLQNVSQIAPCLSLAIMSSSETEITVYENGVPVNPHHSLTPYLAEHRTTDDLQGVLNGTLVEDGARTTEDFPMDILPDDLQEQAQNLNPKHINKMFSKLMKRVNKRIGNSDADAARALLQSGVDWATPAGRQVRTLLDILNVDEGGITPNFVDLRDAYQIHQRRAKKPNAILYPGDEEAMKGVPNALDYTPIYAGKDE